jgi:Ca2+-binding RTX toxin-like protein
MADLRLAGNYINFTGIMGGLGHLQLVLANGANQQEIEVQAPASVFAGDWQYPAIRNHASTDNTPNFGDPDRYAAVKIDLVGRSADAVWDILSQVRSQFVLKGGDIDYDVSQNSNSFVTSLLYTVGINTATYLGRATPPDVSSFPGVETNVLLKSDTAITLDLRGTASADLIVTGIRNDTVTGGGGNDTISGGAGSDTLDGGAGRDVARFDKALSSYSFGFDAATDQIIVIDKANGDKDTLINFESLRFSDRTITPVAEDISFVIDTTGSMVDDIDSVKAAATTIINAIFNPANGLIDTRVNVVGYKDPGEITIFTSFTDQLLLEDRKSTVQAAINAIDVDGGGDYPEGVYSGLLASLNGDGGLWNPDASIHRLILFGDAPANDEYLRAQVLALAADARATLPSAPTVARSLAPGLDMTTFDLLAADGAPIKVEVYSVVVGGDPDALELFSDISMSTGGATFNPEDAGDVVAALLAAIAAPPGVPGPVASGDTFVFERMTQADAANFTAADSLLVLDSSAASLNVTLQGATGLTFESIVLSDGTHTLTYSAEALGAASRSGNLIFTNRDTLVLGDSGDQSMTAVRGAAGKGALLLGFAGKDTITGSIANDTVNGGGGDDVINGSSDGMDAAGNATENDYYMGGAGADQIFGGNGNDHIYGNTVTAAQGANDSGDELNGGDGHDYVQGNVGRDTIEGGRGEDRLYGGADDDTITGDEGFDYLQGNRGKDLLDGGDGNDTLRGGADDDKLYAGADDDVLLGDAGKDMLFGEGGIDILTGGGDADTFVFNPGDAGFATSGARAYIADEVTDYADGTDKFGLTFTVNAIVSGSGAGFTAVEAALTFAQQLLDNRAGSAEVAAVAVGSNTYLFFDENGGGTIDSIIRVDGVAVSQFDTTDFLNIAAPI